MQGENEEFQEYAEFAITDFFLVTIFFLLGLLIQLLLVEPLFQWLHRNHKMTIKNLFICALIFGTATGMVVGLKLGSFELGLSDVITTIAGSIAIFSVYFVSSFMTFKKLSS